jgi:hypothetical protein
LAKVVEPVEQVTPLAVMTMTSRFKQSVDGWVIVKAA